MLAAACMWTTLFLFIAVSFQEPNLLETAKSHLSKGHEVKALEDIENIFKEARQELYPEACQLQFQICNDYFNGKKRKILGLRLQSADDWATEIALRIQERDCPPEIKESAAWALANYYDKKQKHREAEDYFKDYLEDFPESPKRAEVLLKLIRLSRAQFQGIDRSVECIERAESYAEDLIENFPEFAGQNKIGESLLEELREVLAASKFDTVLWYSKRGDWVSAKYSAQRLCAESKLSATPSAQKARSWLQERFPNALKAPNQP